MLFRSVDPAFGLGISSFEHIEGAAFDKNGNMWIADEDGGKVYKFLANQLSGAGLSNNPTPAVVLSPTAESGQQCTQSLDSPYGVAVDSKGNLFVVNAGDTGPNCVGSLAKFSSKSITASGSPVPVVFISSNASGTNLDFSGYPIFGPSIP